MIPANLSQQDILKAIAEIKKSAIPNNRHSAKWSVDYNGELYPPKYLISQAYRSLSGKEWAPSHFSGGEEANGFLESKGFTIVQGGTRYLECPVSSHSWRILSDVVAIKIMDKSSFLHHGTGIPMKIKSFFGVTDLEYPHRKKIKLVNMGKDFKAHFQITKDNRMRLFWPSELESLIQRTLPLWYKTFTNNLNNLDDPPRMRFSRLGNSYNRYHVEFISLQDIINDVDSEVEEEGGPATEGGAKRYYGKRYERNPKNKLKAIEIHGYSCVVCGFNFEEKYGDRGNEYIEVHHLKPLSSLGEEMLVNPETDLITVCSNCHRMIHRKKTDVLSIEEMQQIYNYS